MKKTLFTLFCVAVLLYLKMNDVSFIELSDSLAKNEIGVTFIDESLLLISLEDDMFLLSLKEDVSDSIIRKNDLEKIPIYKIMDNPIIDQLDITYTDNFEFSFVYASKRFCVGNFYDCDFVYLYMNDEYIDGDIYFYNQKTACFIQNRAVLSYSVNPIITIVWDSKNYMIVTY